MTGDRSISARPTYRRASSPLRPSSSTVSASERRWTSFCTTTLPSRSESGCSTRSRTSLAATCASIACRSTTSASGRSRTQKARLRVRHRRRRPSLDRRVCDHGVLMPLDDLVAESRINRADFHAGEWEGTHAEGRQYGVPLLINPEVLFYRRDMLDACGVEPPKTYEPAACRGAQASRAAGEDLRHLLDRQRAAPPSAKPLSSSSRISASRS